VEEKLELKNLNDEFKKVDVEKEPDRAERLNEEIETKGVLYVLKKDDPTVDEDIVKKIPKEWKNEIVMKALEFEGVTEETIKEAKKVLDKQQE